MSSSKIDNIVINRVFDYVIKHNYTPTTVDKLQRKLRCEYAKKIEENKRRIKELKHLTPIELL